MDNGIIGYIYIYYIYIWNNGVYGNQPTQWFDQTHWLSPDIKFRMLPTFRMWATSQQDMLHDECIDILATQMPKCFKVRDPGGFCVLVSWQLDITPAVFYCWEFNPQSPEQRHNLLEVYLPSTSGESRHTRIFMFCLSTSSRSSCGFYPIWNIDKLLFKGDGF